MRAPLTLALACLVIACDHGYAVEIRFVEPGLAEVAQTVEVALVADCGGQTPGEPAVSPLASATARRDESMALGELDPGTYGLLGRALDADCEVIAAGCDPVSLVAGGSGTLRVSLTAATGPGCPAGAVCRAGACEPGDDAGPPGDCPGGCDDSDECTDDACVDGACVYTTRDADSDMHGDDACPAVGGVPADDCDDARPEAFLGAPELCNGQDEDCDEASDESFDCAPGATTRCEACGDGERVCGATCTFGACRPTDAALVAAYTFDEEPALDAFTDRAGAHDGAVVGADASWGPGPFGCGEAFVADGSTPYGEVPNAAEFELASGSIRVWVRFDADGARHGVISRDADGTTLPGHLNVMRDDMGILRARIQNAMNEQTRCTTGPVATGPWHEVIVRWGAPDFEVVVDGVLAADVACDVGVNSGGIEGNMNPWVVAASAFMSNEGAATPVMTPLEGAVGHAELRAGRADPAAPEIVGFVLVDAATDVMLGALSDGAVIDSAALPPFTVRVSTDPFTVDRVRFDLDGTMGFRTENVVPYTLAGDDQMGDYFAWDLAPGAHTLTATAFSAAGAPGPSRTIELSVR